MAEQDPLAQALLDTPPPTPLIAEKPLAATLGKTLSLEVLAAATPGARSPSPDPRRGEVTQPPKAAPRAASSKAPMKAAAKVAAPPPAAEGGSWIRTGVLALLAAGASYYGVTKIFGAPAPAASVAMAPTVVAPTPMPVPVPLAASALAATPPPLQVTLTDSVLPAGTDIPAGNGLLEIQVPDGTAIRVDGEYLGMGPARRVPVTPGAHALALGDGPAQTVTIKLGQRTLASVGSASPPAPAGSP
jgi:hypothetical protein